MSKQTEFDKDLARIFNLYDGLNSPGITVVEAKEAIKQAVDKYVIGENHPLDDETYPQLSHLKARMRQSLWGENHE